MIVKKINNNVAIGVDGNGHEVVLFGKGIGFGELPYSINDMSKIERSFYDIDYRYYNLLSEIPENMFLFTSRIVDAIESKIDGNLNPNLVFILADHINFAVTRYRKGMQISLPYSYEIEFEYPHLTKLAKWIVKNINAKYQVCLDKGEVTSITMHLLNALEGKTNQDDQQHQSQITRIIKNLTKIIEDYFGIVLDKNDFNYFRFKIHLKYYVLRKENNEEFMDGNIDELYDNMKNTYPDIYNCVYNIDQYLYKEFKKSCTSNELLYLMIHVTRLCTREDCNRKGITSA